MSELIFRGNAQIYLQGQDALEPIDFSLDGCMVYYIGSVESGIKVEDFRFEPNHKAKQAILTLDDTDFADVFNLPANVEIFDCGDLIEIRLRDGIAFDEDPMLWLGVWNENEIGNYSILWEEIKRINNDKFAFALVLE